MALRPCLIMLHPAVAAGCRLVCGSSSGEHLFFILPAQLINCFSCLLPHLPCKATQCLGFVPCSSLTEQGGSIPPTTAFSQIESHSFSLPMLAQPGYLPVFLMPGGGHSQTTLHHIHHCTYTYFRQSCSLGARVSVPPSCLGCKHYVRG